MKAWMLALSLFAVIGFTGLANAKDSGKGHKDGTKGTIVSVSGKTFTMTVGGKKGANAGATVTVDTSAATVTGDLTPGAKVNVVGPLTGDKIAATAVTVGHGHKKKAKA